MLLGERQQVSPETKPRPGAARPQSDTSVRVNAITIFIDQAALLAFSHFAGQFDAGKGQRSRAERTVAGSENQGDPWDLFQEVNVFRAR